MDAEIALPGGGVLTMPQAFELARLIEMADEGSTHWHHNNCGCCVTLHGPDYAYVIGPSGEATFYAERGCQCGHAYPEKPTRSATQKSPHDQEVRDADAARESDASEQAAEGG